jgi:hypothetical protein
LKSTSAALEEWLKEQYEQTEAMQGRVVDLLI